MKIKSIKQLKNGANKIVLLRLDLNVPIKNAKILDDSKIILSLETIHFLLNKNYKLLIISHLGRPKKKEEEYSLKPVFYHLKKLVSKKIDFCSEIKKFDWTKAEIIVLENIRFWPEEQENDQKFVQHLASLADIYVNDAFAVSHRQEASVSAITKYLPSYSGLLLEKELINLDKIANPKKPLIVIMGGAKINSKAALINNLAQRADYILLGGALANTFLYFQKKEVGKSMIESKAKENILKLVNNKKIILPLDYSVLSYQKKVELREFNKIKKGDTILDIGPKTIIKFSSLIKDAKTIIWNGPLGYFEDDRFKYGTLSIAILLASLARKKAFVLVGGGETLMALKMTKMANYIDWQSTGGGAMLAYLGKEEMPGLKELLK
jgi:phosphoglycerate kinase